MNDEGPTLSYPHKSDNYTYRVPSPPRIVVPPPTLTAEAIPDIPLNAIRNSRYNFLQHVNYDNLIKQNAPLEWAYERRREAQPILPFLYLGPMTAAKNEVWLEHEGITMLMGIRQRHTYVSNFMSSVLRIAERRGIEHHTVDLASNQDLIQSLPHTTNLINGHLARQFQETGQQSLGKVLVFCESGNERGAGVVAAYLMETHEDVDYVKAMQLCQAQRFCVNFDDGMKRLLQGYWDILCAQRAVVADSTDSEPAKLKSKRGLERDEEEDDTMVQAGSMDSDDTERFSGRVFSPFVDMPL